MPKMMFSKIMISGTPGGGIAVEEVTEDADGKPVVPKMVQIRVIDGKAEVMHVAPGVHLQILNHEESDPEHIDTVDPEGGGSCSLEFYDHTSNVWEEAHNL